MAAPGWFCSTLLPCTLQHRVSAAEEPALTSLLPALLCRSKGSCIGPWACGGNSWGFGWKTPLAQAPEGKPPRCWVFGFVVLFFFVKVLNLQASLVGILFNWYGKGLSGGEGRGWPLISEHFKLVKLATGLLFTVLISLSCCLSLLCKSMGLRS